MILATEDPTARNTMMEDGGYFLVRRLAWGLLYMGKTANAYTYTHT